MSSLVTPNLVSAVVGALVGALVGTALTYRNLRRANRKAGAFDLMLRIQEKLNLVQKSPVAYARQDILNYYATSGGTLSPAGVAYLDYLSALDFFLFAGDREFIDSEDAEYWLRDLLTADAETTAFILKLREQVGNQAALEFLLRHLNRQTIPRTKRRS